MAPLYKLKSFVALLAILLLLMSSIMAIAAQSNVKLGRKLFQNQAYGGAYPVGNGYGGYSSPPIHH
ncbi:hypothetical protein TSUD_302210 [Trifolium subterraneum]|uniref:Uncharacterized protein n=1 Tax=Trifolium subterraneum TaxID=3900 RepID=A0A2Z6NGE9_TRISU|nr:hypothetical protein TSUD_302210 [Trifolium subterraneum]